MEKMILRMDQLLATAFLLNIKRISNLDIKILKETFLSKNPNYEFNALKTSNIINLIKIENEKISLKDDLTLNVNLIEKFKQIADPLYKDITIEEFMLRKINYLNRIDVETIDKIFCKTQLKELNRLDNKGYLTTIWYDDIPNDDCKQIRLSNYGNRQLFKIEYKAELEDFIKRLDSLGYNAALVNDFLLTQDLESLPVFSILKIERFEEYCMVFNRNMYKQKTPTLKK